MPGVSILGIDPGSAATGYGLVEREGGALRHIAHGVLRPPRALAPAGRLAWLHRTLLELARGHAPEVAVVEQVFVRAGNPKSALVLAEARGVVRAALAEAGLEVAELTPQEVKRSVTGSGNAKKPQVADMVKRLLALPAAPPADAADALAVAICRAHQGPLAGQAQRRGRPRPRASGGLRVVRPSLARAGRPS